MDPFDYSYLLMAAVVGNKDRGGTLLYLATGKI